MINMSNHRHITDVFLLVHDITELLRRKLHLQEIKYTHKYITPTYKYACIYIYNQYVHQKKEEMEKI